MAQGTPIPHRAGLYVGFLQLLLMLGWVTYAFYLPRLAAQAGIPAYAVIWLLMFDQVVFAITDFIMGIASDRLAGRGVGRVSRLVVVLTAVSCAAFVALPWVAATGVTPVFLGLTALWAATSSVLRAPTLKLLSKYAPRPQIPWVAGLVTLGFGVAGALTPYVTATLRGADPRVPFVISSVVLLIACFGLAWVERGLAKRSSESTAEPGGPWPQLAPLFLFLAAAVILAAGFQVHASINSGALFRKFVAPAQVEFLMPVFWVAFSLAALGAGWLAARWDRLAVTGAAALVGAVAVEAARLADGLEPLMATQFVAGAAWGCIVTGVIAAAPSIGGKGREGLVLGLVFSAFAIGTFARMAAVSAGVPANTAYATALAWTPPLAWAVGGLALLALAALRRPERDDAPGRLG